MEDLDLALAGGEGLADPRALTAIGASCAAGAPGAWGAAPGECWAGLAGTGVAGAAATMTGSSQGLASSTGDADDAGRVGGLTVGAPSAARFILWEESVTWAGGPWGCWDVPSLVLRSARTGSAPCTHRPRPTGPRRVSRRGVWERLSPGGP